MFGVGGSALVAKTLGEKKVNIILIFSILSLILINGGLTAIFCCKFLKNSLYFESLI
jgi:hypothetical protein